LTPGAFQYPTGSNPEAPGWASLDADVLSDDRSHGIFNLSVFARIGPGASLDAARAQVAALTPHLVYDLPAHLASGKPALQVVRLRDQVVGSVRAPLLAFLAAVSCLLLVACVNVTSLVLARAMSRRHEFATRFALGARPLRLGRQLLTESALLAILGSALGLGLAWASRRAFVAISLPMPRLEESDIGAPAVMFAVVGMLIATCVTGIVPALQASRQSVVDGLRRVGGAGGDGTMFSKPLATLAAAEVALVLVLLAGTGLLVNSFARLILFDIGFDARSMVMLTIERRVTSAAPSAPAARKPPEQTVAVLSQQQREMLAADDEVIQRVSAIPGVAATALTGDDPFGPPYRYTIELQVGSARSVAQAALRIASPSACDGLRLRIVAGRWFRSSDRDGTPFVAVVNETMARRFWGERGSPIGDRIIFGYRSMQVVGIVADVRDRGAREPVRPAFYVSATQMPPDPVMLVVRTAPGFSGIENAIAADLAQMGNRIKPHSPRRPEDIWWAQLADARFLTVVLSVFSLVALAVALIGVHGVLRFMVAQRAREMGIRKALGATRLDLVRLVLGQALRFTLPGCVVGLAAAAAAGPAIRSMLFDIDPTDPLTLAAATLLLVVTILAGAYFPARRAGAVDAALSLRAE
jgi:putative ABC transport system permease protein